MKRKAYSRGEREGMILDVLYTMVGDGNEPCMTAYGMAKALGMNSAQHVRNIMENMVRDGRMEYIQKEHRPGVYKKVYCPKPLIPLDFDEFPKKPKVRFMGREVK